MVRQLELIKPIQSSTVACVVVVVGGGGGGAAATTAVVVATVNLKIENLKTENSENGKFATLKKGTSRYCDRYSETCGNLKGCITGMANKFKIFLVVTNQSTKPY